MGKCYYMSNERDVLKKTITDDIMDQKQTKQKRLNKQLKISPSKKTTLIHLLGLTLVVGAARIFLLQDGADGLQQFQVTSDARRLLKHSAKHENF